jgi:uncharacterized protein YggE
MRSLFLCLVIALAAALPSAAQNAPLVINRSTATVYAPPAFVGFFLRYRQDGESLEASLTRADSFVEALRADLAESGVKPQNVNFASPALPDVRENTVHTSANLVFSMAPFLHREKGLATFASLCETLRALAEKHGCVLQGPLFEAEDAAAVVESAVMAATEDAYAAASAVAAALNSVVVAVDSVEIEEVAWNKDKKDDHATPQLRELSCSAKVKVTYLLGSAL